MKALDTTKRNSKSKESVDFFETQDSTIDILYNNFLKHKLPPIQETKGKTWDYNTIVADFCCGKDAITRRIFDRVKEDEVNKERVRCDTLSSDIIDRGHNTIHDMFKLEEGIDPPFGEDADSILMDFHRDIHIVMNPPFNKLTETMDYYLQLKKKYPNIKSLCLLHSARSLEGIARHKIMEQHGYPSLILNMTKRQSFNTYFKNNEKRVWTPTFSCVWSIWDDTYNGKTEFRYIKE